MFRMEKMFKSISVFIMSFFYIMIGLSHFKNPEWYIQIIPPVLPMKLELVYLSGIFEIILGLLLFFKKTRPLAGWGLIILLIAVYPANIYLAITNGEAMETSSLIAWGRLPIQFIFISLAYWHIEIEE
tara:strand:- start:108 stop:491 length:384 start_codon:yes stop_codon:yes gene_type:complete